MSLDARARSAAAVAQRSYSRLCGQRGLMLCNIRAPAGALYSAGGPARRGFPPPSCTAVRPALEPTVAADTVRRRPAMHRDASPDGTRACSRLTGTHPHHSDTWPCRHTTQLGPGKPCCHTLCTWPRVPVSNSHQRTQASKHRLSGRPHSALRRSHPRGSRECTIPRGLRADMCEHARASRRSLHFCHPATWPRPLHAPGHASNFGLWASAERP